jgi:hypothetical protein
LPTSRLLHSSGLLLKDVFACLTIHESTNASIMVRSSVTTGNLRQPRK